MEMRIWHQTIVMIVFLSSLPWRHLPWDSKRSKRSHGAAPVGIAGTDVTGASLEGSCCFYCDCHHGPQISPLHCNKLKRCNKRPQATAGTCHSVLSHPSQPCLTSWSFPGCWSTVSPGAAVPAPQSLCTPWVQGKNVKVKGHHTVLLSFPPVHTLLRRIFSPLRLKVCHTFLMMWPGQQQHDANKPCWGKKPGRGACPRLLTPLL